MRFFCHQTTLLDQSLSAAMLLPSALPGVKITRLNGKSYLWTITMSYAAVFSSFFLRKFCV